MHQARVSGWSGMVSIPPSLPPGVGTVTWQQVPPGWGGIVVLGGGGLDKGGGGVIGYQFQNRSFTAEDWGNEGLL